MRGFEQLYEVSNLGRVRSVARAVEFGDTAWRQVGGGAKQPFWGRCGLYVSLCGKGHAKLRLVRNLVAEAFIGPADLRRFLVEHINDDFGDCQVFNLRYAPLRRRRRYAGYEADPVLLDAMRADRRNGAPVAEIAAKYAVDPLLVVRLLAGKSGPG